MSAIVLPEPYRPRETRCLELWQPPGWRLKVYLIRHRGRDLPSAELLASARGAVQPHLDAPGDPGHHGVGFLILHLGRDANYAILNWWTGTNMLYQHLYRAPTDRPDAWAYLTPTGWLACVWELRVHVFERDAWIETVLANPNGPDLDAYLDRRLSECPVGPT